MLLAAITIQEEKKRCLTPRFKKTKKTPGSSRSSAAESQASESTLSSNASTVSASVPTKKEVFVVIKAD